MHQPGGKIQIVLIFIELCLEPGLPLYPDGKRKHYQIKRQPSAKWEVGNRTKGKKNYFIDVLLGGGHHLFSSPNLHSDNSVCPLPPTQVPIGIHFDSIKYICNPTDVHWCLKLTCDQIQLLFVFTQVGSGPRTVLTKEGPI